jgi:hypothetical protein
MIDVLESFIVSLHAWTIKITWQVLQYFMSKRDIK